MANSIPTGKISRGAVVGKTIIKIGVKQTSSFIKRSLGTESQKKSIQEQTDKDIADIIFESLGELKGVSVKIAQQIALGMPFLPPAYIDKISQSFHSIPPINKALVRKIIKSQLGRYPSDVFDSFEMDAFAGASLGQVHRAYIDKTPLAVKVQYTGIKRSIQTDMSIIQFSLRRFAKGKDVSHIITEITDRLYEEIDYAKEAKNCDFFRENLHIENIVIPKVYHNLSTASVITTSMIDGLSWDEYMSSNPTQQEKNSYAQLIFDSFFHSLYILKKIHADPNPGNFIFIDKGKLGLIDFGCIKEISDEFLDAYNSLHLTLLEKQDDTEIIAQYIKLGMIDIDRQDNMQYFYQEVIKPLDRLYAEPLIGDSYDFATHNDFSKRGFEMIFEVQKKKFYSVHKLNEQFLFINRTLLGYYALFEKMGAKIDTTRVKDLMRSRI